MADTHDRRAIGLHLTNSEQALVLENGIAYGQRFVDKDDVGVDVNRRGKRQPHEHAARIHLDRLGDELADTGEALDVRQASTYFLQRHANDRPEHLDVLTTCELRMKPRAELEQRRHPAAHGCAPAGGTNDAGHDLEHRALPRSIRADDTQCLAALDTKIDVLERREVGVKNRSTRQEHFDRAMSGIPVNLVRLGDVLEFDDWFAHQSTSANSYFNRLKTQYPAMKMTREVAQNAAKGTSAGT